MSDRFSNLQPFLPPPRDRAPVDDSQEAKVRARPRRRLRIGSLRTWMRMTGLVTVTVLVAVIGGGAAARLTLDGDAFTPPEIRPAPVRVAAPGGAPAAPVRADRVLGVRRHRSTRPSHRPTRKEPRPARRARRVPRSAAAAPVAAPAASPAPRRRRITGRCATGPNRCRQRKRSRRRHRPLPTPRCSTATAARRWITT